MFLPYGRVERMTAWNSTTGGQFLPYGRVESFRYSYIDLGRWFLPYGRVERCVVGKGGTGKTFLPYGRVESFQYGVFSLHSFKSSTLSTNSYTSLSIIPYLASLKSYSHSIRLRQKNKS